MNWNFVIEDLNKALMKEGREALSSHWQQAVSTPSWRSSDPANRRGSRLSTGTLKMQQRSGGPRPSSSPDTHGETDTAAAAVDLHILPQLLLIDLLLQLQPHKAPKKRTSQECSRPLSQQSAPGVNDLATVGGRRPHGPSRPPMRRLFYSPLPGLACVLLRDGMHACNKPSMLEQHGLSLSAVCMASLGLECPRRRL